MKINTKLITIIGSIVLFFTSCQKLDMEQDTGVDNGLMWNNPSYVDNYIIDMISEMPTGFNTAEFGWTFYANASDEAENSSPLASIQNMNTGNWNSTTGFLDNVWTKYYEGIFKANLFLEKAKEITYETYAPATRTLYLNRLNYYKSEVKFLRALFYYELIKHYGGVVLVGDKTALDLENIDDQFKNGRSTFTESANYIVNECNALITSKALPLLDAGADQGRPNGTAVKALKCKTLLLLASPVYNKTVTEGSVAQATYWKLVATAAQEIAFDKIFSFGPYDKYDGTSPEVILGYRHKNVNQLEKRNFPIGCEGVDLSNGSTNPTQNLVDAYRMLNGKKITDDGSGFDPANPYANRDNRLLQTVIVNGSTWKERNVEDRTIEIFKGGRDGMDRDLGTKTGYYLRKFVNPILDLRQGQGSNSEWPIFRFADIILIWAEAVNELYGPVNRGEYYLTATTILNQTLVRHGGLTELPLTGITKEELRSRIREERFIELAFEGQREWDLRRWGIAKSVLNQPVYKMDITRNSIGTYTYQKQKLEDRYFDDRMNLYPIPQRDVNNGLTQNPGW